MNFAVVTGNSYEQDGMQFPGICLYKIREIEPGKEG